VHIPVDRKDGFVRCYTVTNAAANDGMQLFNVLDLANTASYVWADIPYRPKVDEAHPARHVRPSKIHFQRQLGLKLSLSQHKPERVRSKVCLPVETVFAS